MLAALIASIIASPITVAIDRHVLGYKDRMGWHNITKTFVDKNPKLMFTCLSLNKKIKTIGPFGLVGADDEPPNGWFIDSEKAAGVVSVTGISPRFPRPLKEFTANSTYRAIVHSYLEGAGVKKPKARIVKAFRIDLDGDGTMEVILNARNRDDLNMDSIQSVEGDYSLVLLRAISKGKVVQTPLQFTYNGQYSIEKAEVNCVVDLDSDGKMEIITSGKGYEWSTGRIWSYSRGTAKNVLEAWEGV